MAKQLVAVVLILLSGLGIGASAWSNCTCGENGAKENILRISGSSEITVVPDVGEIVLGVTQDSTQSSQAQAQVKQKMLKLIEQLNSSGIKKEEIKTLEIRLDPQRDYNHKPPVIKGYTATQRISIKLSEKERLPLLNTVIEVAERNANIIESVHFSLSEKLIQEKNQEILTSASKNAMKNAQAVLESLRLHVVSIKQIQLYPETSQQPNFPIMYKSADMARASYAGSSPESMPDLIEPGEMKMQARVDLEISYE